MIYNTLAELFRGCLYSLIYGIICAGIYISQNEIVGWIINIFKIPVLAFNHNNKGKTNINNHSALKEGICDLVFFLLCGVGFILLQYIALDGAFRIFFLIIFLFGFFLSQYSIGKIIKIGLNFILRQIYLIIFKLFKAICLPIRLALKLLSLPFKPLLLKVKGYINKKKEKVKAKPQKNKNNSAKQI